MIRLGISVEGATEREFILRVLAPHLARYGVFANPVDMRGNVSRDRIRGALPHLIASFDHVSTLYDYYRFKQRETLSVDALQAAMLELVAPAQRRHFTPYIQLHEFEALLFAVPELTVQTLGGTERQLHALRAAVDACGSPEAVNDRPETSPSHRLLALFGRDYEKPFHGPEVLRIAGLPAIRAQCPRFDAWVTRLENLGGRA